jgi:hypothetical protein
MKGLSQPETPSRLRNGDHDHDHERWRAVDQAALSDLARTEMKFAAGEKSEAERLFAGQRIAAAALVRGKFKVGGTLRKGENEELRKGADSGESPKSQFKLSHNACGVILYFGESTFPDGKKTVIARIQTHKQVTGLAEASKLPIVQGQRPRHISLIKFN